MNFLSLILFAFLAVAQGNKINFCYYPNYASNVLKASNIKAEYCSHIGYSFFQLAADGTCFLEDPAWEGNILKELMTVKSAKTKICPVIGGYGRSSNFGPVASNPQARQTFVRTCSTLMKQYGFDNCFDVDWEFPQENERDAFVALLQDIKSGMGGVELFTAVSAGKWQMDISYQNKIPQIAATVDYINVMTYDYHGSWESNTGMNSALTGPPGDISNIAFTVNYFISNGAPANKLNVGVPFYGRTFGLTTSATNVGAPSSGGDTLEYSQICADNGWVVTRDSSYQVPYAVKGSTWLSFDDVQSVTAKAKFVNDKGLAGTLIWSIQQDDTKGTCGQGTWPLLTAVNNGLNGNSGPSPAPAPAPAPSPAPAPAPAPPPSGGVFKCPSTTGYYVDTQSGSSYHYCNGGYDMGKQSCPQGSYFVSLEGGKSYACDYTSPEPAPVPAPSPAPAPAPAPAPPPSGGVFKCPSTFGYYVDTQSCSSYHYCNGGYDMGKQSCPQGLYFVSLEGGSSYACDYTSPLC